VDPRLLAVMALLFGGCRAVVAADKLPHTPIAETPSGGAPILPAGLEDEPAPHRPIADHVIILSEDGMRPDALLQAKAPHHAVVMREGASSMRARTIRLASTLPSHAAMLSGFDVGAHGLDWNSWRPERGFIKVPTVFTAVSAAGKESAVFVGKRKLEHITQPGEVHLFSRPGFFCKKVVHEAAAHFAEHRPQVEFVHFSDPDESGHHVGWMTTEQLTSIGHADRCLGTMMAAIRNSGVHTRTLLIISADHGGEGRNHSGATAADRVIPWIAWGAGVRRNYKIRGNISTMDTAATVLWALGYDPPAGLGGRPVIEAFEIPSSR